MLSRHPPPCSQNYRHLASLGCESRGRCYGSSQRQNLFRTMSIQNRFVLWKQAEMKSLQRSCVFAIHNPVGRAEGSCRSINPRFGQVNGCSLPHQLQWGLGAPQQSRIWKRTVGTCSAQMGYSGLQPWCWAVPTIPQGLWDQGRVHHQGLGFLMKTVASVPPLQRLGLEALGGILHESCKGEKCKLREHPDLIKSWRVGCAT